MKMPTLVKSLYIENEEFVTAKKLKELCKLMKLSYDNVVHNLEKRGYLARIFRGIFYLKPIEELELGRSKYNHLEIVAKGLELKGVKNWYFGLHSALKINNMTHEHFSIEEVINDEIFRSEPISITGYKFKFIKLSSEIVKIGIKEKNGIKYSDPEKTILDFIYVWRYNGKPAERIVADVSEWALNTSRKKLLLYAKKYPKTVEDIATKIKN